MTSDNDIDAAIQALEAVKLFTNAYGTSEKAFDGIRAAADALYARDWTGNSPLRKGVAEAIRQHFGPIS